MQSGHGVYAALEALPLGGKRLAAVGGVVPAAMDESGSNKAMASAKRRKVGNTTRSLPGARISIARSVDVFVSNGTYFINEPDFVRIFNGGTRVLAHSVYTCNGNWSRNTNMTAACSFM